MLELLASPEAWLALITLVALEVVLGIDNIIFISILVGRVPPEQRQLVRRLGLGLAMLTRIGLLLSLTWLMGLTTTLFTVMDNAFSWRDLILGVGGLFLLAKSTLEIHASLEGEEVNSKNKAGQGAIFAVLAQIAIIDIIFSLDSVITAVGMVKDIPIMIAAIIISVGMMLFAAKSIGDFVGHHPTIKMLALSFLILIGFALVGESLDVHVPKAYIYFAMGFSVAVEMINIRLRKKISQPVSLRIKTL